MGVFHVCYMKSFQKKHPSMPIRRAGVRNRAFLMLRVDVNDQIYGVVGMLLEISNQRLKIVPFRSICGIFLHSKTAEATRAGCEKYFLRAHILH